MLYLRSNSCARQEHENKLSNVIFQIYDLHIGDVGEQSATGSKDGCPVAEKTCADNCPINSTCVGDLTGNAVCTCNPGLRGDRCDIGEKYF